MKRARGTKVISWVACMLSLGLAGTFAGAQVTGSVASPQENSARPSRIRVGANVPKVTGRTPPEYPQAAIDRQVEGDVVIHLIISRDGTVKELNAVSGPALLTDPAMAAVRGWMYQPARLNGNSVEVDTTVTLNYVLGPPPTVMVNNRPVAASAPIANDPAQQPSTAVAPQANADTPATKEDIERYLEAIHSHDMMKQIVEQMSKPMHQMVHDQLEKDREKLPPDFEARLNKMIDGMLNDLPWDELMQSMVPVYQKHFTKGDIDVLIAFYSTPTGQKMLKEMPTIMAESMQAEMPIMQRQMEAIRDRVQQEIAKSLRESQRKNTAPTQN